MFKILYVNHALLKNEWGLILGFLYLPFACNRGWFSFPSITVNIPKTGMKMPMMMFEHTDGHIKAMIMCALENMVRIRKSFFPFAVKIRVMIKISSYNSRFNKH